MECKTFRIKGHAEHDDPAKYVPAELLEEWRKKDPIDCYVKYLTEQRILSESELLAMGRDLEQVLEHARKEALESPLPQPEDAQSGIFE